MTKTGNVIEALAAVMAELPGISKDQKASPQQGGYAYRGIEAITSHAAPLFAKHGVVFVPRVVSHDVKEIIVNGKPWTDTYALVEYTVYGPGGRDDSIVVGPILAVGRDNADKGGNKCLTQAFKYALIQTLCIADAKDDADAGSPEADHAPKRPTPVPSPATPSRVDEVGKIVETTSVTVEDVQETCGAIKGEPCRVNDLDDEEYAELLVRLRELAQAEAS